MTLLDRLNRYSPMACRLFARTAGRGGFSPQRPLTNKQIAARSGLAPSTVSALSKLTKWDTVRLDTAQRFMDACGVNPLAAKNHRLLLRYSKLSYWVNGTIEQQRMIARIRTALMANGLGQSAAAAEPEHAAQRAA